MRVNVSFQLSFDIGDFGDICGSESVAQKPQILYTIFYIFSVVFASFFSNQYISTLKV